MVGLGASHSLVKMSGSLAKAKMATVSRQSSCSLTGSNGLANLPRLQSLGRGQAHFTVTSLETPTPWLAQGVLVPLLK